MLRLELGIPAELVELAQAMTTPFTRLQWMRLREAGLVTIEAVQQQPSSDPKKVLGDQHAAEVLQRELRAHAERRDELPPLLEFAEPSE